MGFVAGHGGRVTSGMSLSAYVVKNLALEMKDDSHPREAILKHAKVQRFCQYSRPVTFPSEEVFVVCVVESCLISLVTVFYLTCGLSVSLNVLYFPGCS